MLIPHHIAEIPKFLYNILLCHIRCATLDGDVVRNVKFTGGCNGNLKGISAIVDGMKVGDIEKKLSGITCGFKNTSCPDQLARAVAEAYAKQNG